ncbi:hypothetical protein [Thalassospira sp.]|uniref:hypothetical protein n=1 Tax=Thalassospira sp. TaxID=1912094 RepID=UPI002735F2E3|nr:hypothetical protein [Thalassospira sp.]MDP2696695.1 hypothetical protein [Thalassospira sp.]
MKIFLKYSAATALAGAALIVSMPAHAYVGPGAGLSLLGALWALLAAVVVAVGFVVLWPIRKMMRKRKNAAAARDAATTVTAEHKDHAA